MIDEWKARRGYDPTKLLPALTNAGRQGTTAPFYDFADGARVRNDYRQMWSDLYIANRLDPLREWAHSRTGSSSASSPTASRSTAPRPRRTSTRAEGESFGFGNNIERYKTVVTGAHFSGQKVTSTEAARVRRQRLELDRQGQRAARPTCTRSTARSRRGVTQIVYHGFPYLADAAGHRRDVAVAGLLLRRQHVVQRGLGPAPAAVGGLRQGQRQPRPPADDPAPGQAALRRRRLLAAVRHQPPGCSPRPRRCTRTATPTTTSARPSCATRRRSSRTASCSRTSGASRRLLLNGQATMPLDVAQKLLALAQAGPAGRDRRRAAERDHRAPRTASRTPRVAAAMASCARWRTSRSSPPWPTSPARSTALGVKPATACAPDTTAALLRCAARRRTSTTTSSTTRPTRRAAHAHARRAKAARTGSTPGRARPRRSRASRPAPVQSPCRSARREQRRGDRGHERPVGDRRDRRRGPAAAATTAHGGRLRRARRPRDPLHEPGTFATTLSDGRTVTTTIGDVAAPDAAHGLVAERRRLEPARLAQRRREQAHAPTARSRSPRRRRRAARLVDINPANGYAVDLTDVSGIGTYTTTLDLPSLGRPGGYLDLGRPPTRSRLTVNGRWCRRPAGHQPHRSRPVPQGGREHDRGARGDDAAPTPVRVGAGRARRAAPASRPTV